MFYLCSTGHLLDNGVLWYVLSLLNGTSPRQQSSLVCYVSAHRTSPRQRRSLVCSVSAQRNISSTTAFFGVFYLCSTGYHLDNRVLWCALSLLNRISPRQRRSLVCSIFAQQDISSTTEFFGMFYLCSTGHLLDNGVLWCAMSLLNGTSPRQRRSLVCSIFAQQDITSTTAFFGVLCLCLTGHLLDNGVLWYVLSLLNGTSPRQQSSLVCSVSAQRDISSTTEFFGVFYLCSTGYNLDNRVLWCALYQLKAVCNLFLTCFLSSAWQSSHVI